MAVRAALQLAALCLLLGASTCTAASFAAAAPNKQQAASSRDGQNSGSRFGAHRRKLQADAPAVLPPAKLSGTPDPAAGLAAPGLATAQPAAAAAAQPVALPADDRSIVTNQTMRGVLSSVASPNERAVLFTTFTLGKDPAVTAEILDMLRNFCHYQQGAGLLRHTLLLTVDESSWRQARAAGLPAVWDRSFSWQHPGNIVNRIFDVQKHWWGMRIIEEGFHAVYLDSDNMVFGDLLGAFIYQWDVQGLSDWVQPELLPTGATVNFTCALYFTVREERVALRSELRAYWDVHPEGQAAMLNATNPCQSTGLWLLRPTPLTVRFMQAMAHRIMWQAPWQWDQTAWNDVILSFLWGMGDDGQLRYRLLPHSQYSNIDVYEARKRQGLPIHQVVLHAGYVHGKDKVGRYEAVGLWHPEAFVLQQPQWASATTYSLADGGISSGMPAGLFSAAAAGSTGAGVQTAGLLQGSAAMAGAAVVAAAAAAGVWGWRRQRRLGGPAGGPNNRAVTLVTV